MPLSREEFRQTAQMNKAWRLAAEHRRFRKELTPEQRHIELMLFDDRQWSRLRRMADVNATKEPGSCEVSREVKQLVFGFALGTVVRYADRDQSAI